MSLEVTFSFLYVLVFCLVAAPILATHTLVGVFHVIFIRWGKSFSVLYKSLAALLLDCLDRNLLLHVFITHEGDFFAIGLGQIWDVTTMLF